MNYRHAFHAGNFADVHKHVVLLALLARLAEKPKPLFYLDTHAGRGWYDLRSADAARGAEWRAGVSRVARMTPHSEELSRYLGALRSAGAADPDEPRRYPGSPLLAAHALRASDRIVLVEQQLTEAKALEQATASLRGVSVVCGDGYAALKTYLPPRENRGLVLIDPPYESDREFADAEQALRFGLTRWSNGVFALWYPIKAGAQAQRLNAALRASGLRKLLRLELTVRPADSPLGLNGSGLVIANPPWKFDGEMRDALVELRAALEGEGA
ncbi:MAG: 23S rRNA (adenine(2030)-N(6))-methyltransferase RlmJ, partial [Steroidobacteraceae bacterium]